MSQLGVDALPEYTPPSEFERKAAGDLVLLSGAAHHFVSSSMANQPSLRRKEGEPSIEMHPLDAANRGISHGDLVKVENGRGWCLLKAEITEDVLPGVTVAPKGHWATLELGGRNVNWLTSDALADLGNQATFHSNFVSVHPVAAAELDALTARTSLETAVHV
jgi:anaerobic selenocysteine-containing dehydrogenase